MLKRICNRRFGVKASSHVPAGSKRIRRHMLERASNLELAQKYLDDAVRNARYVTIKDAQIEEMIGRQAFGTAVIYVPEDEVYSYFEDAYGDYDYQPTNSDMYDFADSFIEGLGIGDTRHVTFTYVGDYKYDIGSIGFFVTVTIDL